MSGPYHLLRIGSDYIRHALAGLPFEVPQQLGSSSRHLIARGEVHQEEMDALVKENIRKKKTEGKLEATPLLHFVECCNLFWYYPDVKPNTVKTILTIMYAAGLAKYLKESNNENYKDMPHILAMYLSIYLEQDWLDFWKRFPESNAPAITSELVKLMTFEPTEEVRVN
jgi:hypothetical protein